jgi:protein-tyrosine phosphatase
MAEGIFSKMVEEAGLVDKISVDSAGTSSWHVGEPAHSGTRSILDQNGISYIGQARKVKIDELKDENTYLIAMDRNNLGNIRAQNPGHPQMYLLLEFAKEANELEVPDPYYHNNFEYVYKLVEDGCRGLLDYIRSSEKI